VGFPKRQAAIVGVYTTKQGKLPERTRSRSSSSAIRGALDERRLTTATSTALLPMAMTDHSGTTAQPVLAEQLGERPLGLVGDRRRLGSAGQGRGGDRGRPDTSRSCSSAAGGQPHRPWRHQAPEQGAAQVGTAGTG